MSTNSIIDLKNVGLQFTQPKNKSVTILSNINLSVSKPCIIQLIGPSGSGKSKLLRLINRLEDPTSGMIFIHGKDIKSIPIQKLRRSVQMMQQEPVLVADTIIDNLKLPWTVLGEALPTDFQQQADRSLELAKLERDRATQKVDQLSVGQKQRVSFARALLTKPEILLLDEPTSALDANLAFELLDTIRSVQLEQLITVLMVTHRLDEVKYINDHVAVITEGELIEFGSSNAVMNQPQNPKTSDFLKSFLRNDRKSEES